MAVYRDKSGRLFTDDYYTVISLCYTYYCNMCMDNRIVTSEFSNIPRICGLCVGKIRRDEPIYVKKRVGLFTILDIVVGYKKILNEV